LAMILLPGLISLAVIRMSRVAHTSSWAHFWKGWIANGTWLFWISMEPAAHIRYLPFSFLGAHFLGALCAIAIFAAPMLLGIAIQAFIWRKVLPPNSRGIWLGILDDLMGWAVFVVPLGCVLVGLDASVAGAAQFTWGCSLAAWASRKALKQVQHYFSVNEYVALASGPLRER